MVGNVYNDLFGDEKILQGINIRIKEVRLKNNLGQQEFADKLNVSVGTISKIESGKQIPSAETLSILNIIFGEDINYILNGEKYKKEESDSIPIPRYDVKASAGAGAINECENISEYINIDKKYLNNLGVSTKDLAIIEIAGDSMEPFIKEKDLVILDLSKKTPTEGVYALCLDEYLIVKRLQFLGQHRISVRSDNPQYEKFTINLSESPSAIIIGKVIATLFQRIN